MSRLACFVAAGLLAAAPVLDHAAQAQSRPARQAPAAAQASPMALAPFYQQASRLAPRGQLGQVLLREPVATAIPNAEAWRIAYVSSDLQERATISTALVVAPRGTPPRGGRPIMSWAHGTTGSAQGCGPSQVIDPAHALNQYFMPDGNSWTDYGLPAIEAFIRSGYVVVGTDYQGLGGGGDHQYAVAGTQARDTINAIRAAGSLGLSGADRRAIVYGWSQGGGATIAAASMPDYIARRGTAFDGIDIRGFVAMAPQDVAAVAPTATLDEAAATRLLQGLFTTFSDSVFQFAHLSMMLWGTVAASPSVRMTDIFTEEGTQVMDNLLRRKCMHVLGDTLSYAYGTNYRSLLRDQPANALAWAQAFIAGSVPAVRPVAPVVIYWGTHDVIVPPPMHAAYRQQMCARGGNVARVQLPGEQTHFSTPGVAEPLYMPWVADRLAGRPVANGCAD